LNIDEKSRKKAFILLIVVIIAMLMPMKIQYKDNTVEYKAILYSVTTLHRPATQDHRTGYLNGKQIRILIFTVYDDSVFVPNNIDNVLSPAE